MRPTRCQAILGARDSVHGGENAIAGAVLDRLGEVGHVDGVMTGEVGDRASEAEHAVERASGESEAADRGAEQLLAGAVDAAMGAHVGGRHHGVGVDAVAIAESTQLPCAGIGDAGADARGGIGGGGAEELAVGEGGHLDVEVDAVEQRTGDPAAIALNLTGVTDAAGVARAVEAAGTGIHGGDEHDAGRIGDGVAGSAQPDDAVLDGLAERFEHVPAELGQLVEEEHAVVRERDLAGSRNRAAADETGIGHGVMGRAERPLLDEPLPGSEPARDGVDLGDLDGLVAESGGRMPGRRRASIDFPEPGGPMSSTLCCPAAATSSARFACSCPFTSAKSRPAHAGNAAARSGPGSARGRGRTPRR